MKEKKPARIATATAKKAAARAGHVAVSNKAVPIIREMYEERIAELVPKLLALLELTGRKTVKTADVQRIISSGVALSTALPAEE